MKKIHGLWLGQLPSSKDVESTHGAPLMTEHLIIASQSSWRHKVYTNKYKKFAGIISEIITLFIIWKIFIKESN
jgi:hypothetical protein